MPMDILPSTTENDSHNYENKKQYTTKISFDSTN